MNKVELLELLESLKINKDEYVILSSSALMLRGILDTCGDLDIAVTQKGLDELMSNYDLKQKENGWYIVNDKVECVLDDMINQKEKVGQYYLQDLNNYLGFIENSTREKDIKRVELVRKYISDNNM